MNFKEFLVKNRETAQMSYGIILIILIPLLITFNTVFIIKKYNQSLDIALQRQALSISRTISAYFKNDLNDPGAIQSKIESLTAANIELQEIIVLTPDKDNFKIIASSKKDDAGKLLSFYYYQLAWLQPENNGLATDSLRLASTAEGEKMVKDFSTEERFWLVAMPMSGAQGGKQALLSVRLSSKIIDDLTNYNRKASVYLLIGTVLIVMLFLLVAVRLWDYALLYKKIKEVDRMKDDFISIASHELRTPVTGIRGYVSMMLEGSLGEITDKMKDSLKIVISATERLSVLVDDLLNVGRIEQGKIKINAKPTDINPIIKEIAAELKVQADEKGVALIYQPYKNIFPPVSLDTERIKQVMINLIGNAIKYTDRGSVEIITEEKNKGEILEIKIKDSGIGISTKQRERLFEKFYRVQNEKTKNITGTGLGLWITKQLVDLMKGSITVDSIENVGTQVTLQFPIIKNNSK
jgi:signal transduction histidine kinase